MSREACIQCFIVDEEGEGESEDSKRISKI